MRLTVYLRLVCGKAVAAEERRSSETEVEEIAVKTVNRHRRKQGLTQDQISWGIGNSNRLPQDLSLSQLCSVQ